MLFSFIIALLLGIIIGTFTGLTPGIHINLVSAILLSSSAAFLSITSPTTLAVFIIALSITHTFIDFIPSIFLGAPDEDTALSILPGHQMLLSGNGYAAVILSLYGCLSALFMILILTPIFMYLLPIIYPYVSNIMPIIMILVCSVLIYKEKEKKITALMIFLLAGFLGIAALNLNLKDSLLPLLTGLFGTSSLIISIKQKIDIPPQRIIPIKYIIPNKKSLAKTLFASIITSPFTAFLPALGSSPAAVIGSDITELNNQEFLFLIGSINTIVMGLSFITYYSIQKTRTGASVAVSKLIPSLTPSIINTIIITIILSGLIVFIIALFLLNIISKIINKISYTILSSVILIFLVIITIGFTGLLGLLVLATSTALGISCVIMGVKRINLMGCLLIPTILYYVL
jgi:putative membrane protein